MDPQTTSSFIPKKTMVPGGAFVHSDGIFTFVSKLLFVIAIVASLVVFIYQKYLEGQISQMNDSLSQTRADSKPDVIKLLSKSDARIISAKELISKHITLSSFFALLQSLTLQDLRFDSFSYSENEQGVLAISMKGQARTYAAVALQSEIFNQNSNFIKPQFSNLDLDAMGNVIFSFQSQLNPNVVSYESQFSSSNAGSAPLQPPVTTAPPVTVATPNASSTSPVPAP